jgi:uncharacterized membrane protein YdjX (TVP38/TMEM64 family)
LLQLRRVGGLASLTVILPAIGGVILLGSIYQVSPWLQSNAAGVPVFIASVIVFAGVALLPTNFIGVVGGWAFDFPVGWAATWVGVCGASVVMYFIARRLSKSEIDKFLEQKPRVKMLRHALLTDNFGRALLVITLIRLAPGVPFAATNLFLATADVPLRTFLLGTAAGMLPRTAMVVSLGSSLSELSFDRPSDSWSVILSMLATVIIFVILGYVSKRTLDRVIKSNLELQEKGV